MRRDPGPTPIPARNRVKDKPVYDQISSDRGAENRKNWNIDQLRRALGYAIDDEIDWDSVEDVVSFVPIDHATSERSGIVPAIYTSPPPSPEEIAAAQERIRRCGLRNMPPLPDPYSPLPVVRPE